MKNKHFFTITIIILGAFFISACVSNPETQVNKRFDTIMQKAVELDYVDGNRESTIEVGLGTSEFHLGITSKEHIRIDYSDKENIEMHLNLDTSLMGQSITQEIYYIDNYQYIDIGSNKIKAATPMNTVLYLVEGIKPIFMYASDMEELTMEVQDNMYVFSFKVKPEHMLKYASTIFSLPEGIELDSDIANLNQSTFEGTVTADANNVIIASSINAIMEVSLLGILLPFQASNETTYNSYNEPFTIEFPNFDEYTEASVNVLQDQNSI